MDRVASRVATRYRVATRFREVLADNAPGARQHAKKNTHPINKAKGIDSEITSDHATINLTHDDTVKPDRRDVRPEDVFAGTPNQMGVRNLAETGKDLSKAIEKQIPKDKGHDAVSNLSQYLISTQGGGGAKAQGTK